MRRYFALKSADGTKAVRPVDPKTLAAILNRTAASDREVALYPSAGIGYESGPSVYNPATGRQRVGGLSTSVGVGVGVGPSQSGASEQERRVMKMELSEKGLPETTASKPLSGYLYFPTAGKNKNGIPVGMQPRQREAARPENTALNPSFPHPLATRPKGSDFTSLAP